MPLRPTYLCKWPQILLATIGYHTSLKTFLIISEWMREFRYPESTWFFRIGNFLTFKLSVHGLIHVRGLYLIRLECGPFYTNGLSFLLLRFTLKRGKVVCANPKDQWVQNLMLKVDSRMRKETGQEQKLLARKVMWLKVILKWVEVQLPLYALS